MAKKIYTMICLYVKLAADTMKSNFASLYTSVFFCGRFLKFSLYFRSLSTSSATTRYGSDPYKNQPGRIENYVPGHSSISEKEAKEVRMFSFKVKH